MVFDMERFKELMVFVADTCIGDPTFLAVKLNKILYFADFMAYRVYDRRNLFQVARRTSSSSAA